jgi:monooxygenase
VWMLQRSPTYIISVPGQDRIAALLRERLPSGAAYHAVRWKNVLVGMGFYGLCRRFPRLAKKMLLSQVEKQIGDAVDVGQHFTPRYDPWDQRLCLVPDSDMFDAIRDGRASVVTDRIATFTEKGIRLESGAELEADLVVTATGLKLKFLGGMAVEVDGRPVDASKRLVYKGLMLDDVPNLAFAIGYTNASWTLKCDLASEYVCRLLLHMDAHGYAWCCPRRNDPSVEEVPLIDFSSGYVQRAAASLPKQGSRAPWKLHQNYALDRAAFRHGRLTDGTMEFGGAPS